MFKRKQLSLAAGTHDEQAEDDEELDEGDDDQWNITAKPTAITARPLNAPPNPPTPDEAAVIDEIKDELKQLLRLHEVPILHMVLTATAKAGHTL